MKGKMEFHELGNLRYDTKDDRVKTGHFCKFHIDYDHDTNNYRELVVFVEDQFREGKL